MADPAAPAALRAGLVVGGLTATALVGPLVGVSPAWIVLAVVLALGALSLDAARFGGRGGHVLAEALPGGGARLRRIAVHEAGHGLLAEAEGLPLRRVLVGSLACLRAGLNSNGSTEFASEFVMPFLARERTKGEAAPRELEGLAPGVLAPGLPAEELRRWSRVLLAGMVAEELVYGESEGGSDDRALLGRIWGLSGFDVDTAQREQRRARREVEQGLSRRRPELEQRAERLLAQAPRLFHRAPLPPEGEAVAGNSLPSESVLNESIQHDSVQDQTIQSETIQHESIQKESIQKASIHHGPQP